MQNYYSQVNLVQKMKMIPDGKQLLKSEVLLKLIQMRSGHLLKNGGLIEV